MDFGALVATMDRAVQVDLGAIPVVYEPHEGQPVTVQGIFDERYQLLQGGAHAGVESTGPAVWLRLEDLPEDPRQGERGHIVIGSTRYRIRERQTDGVGGSVLMLLHRVAP